ncbi:IDEAL domain protein [compost metagenome]
MQVYHDHKAKLKKDDVGDLIDLALNMGDKGWFEELTNNYTRGVKMDDNRD